MQTYLCRWPNGTLSIVTAEDKDDLNKQLLGDEVCTFEEMDSPDGLIIEIPRGFRIHLHLNELAEFEFYGFRRDAMPTLERLYPHLAAAMKVNCKTKKAADTAARAAAAKEREVRGDN